MEEMKEGGEGGEKEERKGGGKEEGRVEWINVFSRIWINLL